MNVGADAVLAEAARHHQGGRASSGRTALSGSTANDALWAGLPVLICAGDSYVGRMTGSMLHAIGLPELVTTSLAEYEGRALKLAREPARLAQLRHQLADNTARGCRCSTWRPIPVTSKRPMHGCGNAGVMAKPERVDL